MILNKVDLLSSEGSLEELEKEIRDINSLASIVRTVRCQVDLTKILERNAYDTAVKWLLNYSLPISVLYIFHLW